MSAKPTAASVPLLAAAAAGGCLLTLAVQRLLSGASAGRPAAGDEGEDRLVAPPPARVGDSLAEVDTPALLVDLDAFEANVAELDRSLERFSPEVRVRPHVKSHKCAALARLQLRSERSAGGVCAAKVCEAEAMVRGGVADVHLANEVVGDAKLARLAAVARRAEAAGGRLSVCVDSVENLRAVSRHAAEAGCEIGVLAEINTGQDRCGVQTAEGVLEIARAASALPGVDFRGIQGYQGAAQHVRRHEDRAETVAGVAARVREARQLLERNGIEVDTVTGGGTGTYALDAATGVFNELQPGSYVFNDVDYGRNLLADGAEARDRQWRRSLTVLATVMSSNAPHWSVLDAGLKAHSLDSGPPEVLGRPDVECVNGGDEHLIVRGAPGAASYAPAAGERVRLVPGHCDPTCNMHDWIVAHRGDRVVGVYRVGGRGPGF